MTGGCDTAQYGALMGVPAVLFAFELFPFNIASCCYLQLFFQLRFLRENPDCVGTVCGILQACVPAVGSRSYHRVAIGDDCRGGQQATTSRDIYGLA